MPPESEHSAKCAASMPKCCRIPPIPDWLLLLLELDMRRVLHEREAKLLHVFLVHGKHVAAVHLLRRLRASDQRIVLSVENV